LGQTNSLQVVVASDHSIVREGLVHLLSGQGIQVRWEPLASRAAGAHPPDVVLCAIEPRPDIDAVIARLHREFGAAHLICLLLGSDENAALSAIRAGATGVIDESFGATELVDSLNQAHEGKFVMSGGLAVRLAQQYAYAQTGPRNVQPEGELTKREMEVLQLLAEGFKNREIANRLALSEHTVRAHLRGVMQKLQVSNRVQAAALAWRGHGFEGTPRQGGSANGNPGR
jgi:DNA-binding NarL/FixJ family response regulator